MSPFRFFRDRFLNRRRRLATRAAMRGLQADARLWQDLEAYISESHSTGCGHIDYYALYRHIRTSRPREVLECGTGVSTLVIAAALQRNAADGAPLGRVTSMEEHFQWYEIADKLLPDRYRDCTELRLSPTIEDNISLFRGVRYRDVPERPYEFVFVDGPAYDSQVDGDKTCNLDFLHLVRQSDQPISGLIDKRVSTVFVCQRLLGAKVRYEAWTHLAHIAPSSRTDLRFINHDTPSLTFQDSFRSRGSSWLDWPH